MSDYKGKKKWKNSKEMQRKSTWTETAGSSDSHEVAASKLAFQFVRAGVSQQQSRQRHNYDQRLESSRQPVNTWHFRCKASVEYTE